ncbi:MAG: hypothetical protein AABY22_25295 [Nanoarchaeota archaeon]
MKVKSDLLVDFGYSTGYDGSFLHRLEIIFRIIFKKPVWNRLKGKIYKKDIKKLEWI